MRVLDTPGLVKPFGMCLSPDETTLAVAYCGSDCVKLVRVDGSEAPRTIGEEGAGDGQFNFPCDVRFTPDGQQLVVADFNNNRVQVLSTDGTFVRNMPLEEDVYAVSVDVAGNIIVATNTGLVNVFSPDLSTLLHDRLGGLELGEAAFCGLAIDPSSGRIAMGDLSEGRVHLL